MAQIRLGRPALVALASVSLFVLAGCNPGNPATQVAQKKVAAPTSALKLHSAQSVGIDRAISATSLVPNATIPWQGRLLVAPQDGGLEIYSVEGVKGSTQDGGQYSQIVVAPGFVLRSLKTAIALALNADGTPEPILIDDARGEIHDLPVTGLPESGVQAICALPSSPDAPRFAFFSQGGKLDIATIKDEGAAQLVAHTIASADLPISMNSCASVGARLYASNADHGLYEVNLEGTPKIGHGVDTQGGKLVGITTPKGGYLLMRRNDDNAIWQFDMNTLQPMKQWQAVQSLSLPPVGQAGDMDISASNFGGASFHYGLLAIADNSNHHIALIARETLPDLAPAKADDGSEPPLKMEAPKIQNETPITTQSN